jgi:anaerobic magnesium-protoporphyrin IX monomethyl ester cyclase
MKVLLIDPPELFLRGDGTTRQVQPLGLAYVGAAIDDVATVRFLLPDTRSYVGLDPWGELLAAVAAQAPDLIAFTAVTATFPTAARFAAEIKARWPKLPIVLGGVHASTMPEQALRDAPAVDFVVRGEGEAPMRELVAAFDSGQIRHPETIAGLQWLDNGELVRAPPRPPTADLDRVRFPKRDGFVWPDDIMDGLYQAIVTLRGCPYKCIYCAVPSLDDAKTRYRSPANVCDEIAELKQRHGIDYLFFHDSVFTLHRKRTLALCREITSRGLVTPFCCQTRADRLDEELLDAMLSAGLHQVFFGIESGDAESLRRIRKQMPLQQIRDAVAMTRSRGVRTSGFFMIGFPWQDTAMMQQTADFAVTLDLDAISLFSATPLPGTELWEMSPTQQLPASIDFRAPQTNLTSLSGPDYAALYAEIKARVDHYNQERMMAGVAATRVAWMNLPD